MNFTTKFSEATHYPTRELAHTAFREFCAMIHNCTLDRISSVAVESTPHGYCITAYNTADAPIFALQ